MLNVCKLFWFTLTHFSYRFVALNEVKVGWNLLIDGWTPDKMGLKKNIWSLNKHTVYKVLFSTYFYKFVSHLVNDTVIFEFVRLSAILRYQLAVFYLCSVFHTTPVFRTGFNVFYSCCWPRTFSSKNLNQKKVFRQQIVHIQLIISCVFGFFNRRLKC